VTICFVDEARREFLDAVLYYEDARASLGQRFKDEVERTIAWIVAHPDGPRLRPGLYRRVNLRVFPFYISLCSGHASRNFLAHVPRCRLASRPLSYGH